MAIMIAQKHIEQMPEEITTPGAALTLKKGGVKLVLKVGSKLARTADPEEEEVTAEALAVEISAEQSALAEKQRTLALITTGNAAQSYLKGGRGGGANRGSGSSRGGSGGRGGGC
eukprot:931833-Rhodomonas_salina.2